MSETTDANQQTCGSESAVSASKFIKLISADLFEFFIRRDVAENGSETIKSILNAQPTKPNDDGKVKEITFSTIPGDVLEVVCNFLTYKTYYSNPDNFPDVDPESCQVFNIPMELTVDIYKAADFLKC